RRNRNEEYYDLGRNRNIFWKSIAMRINEGQGTNFQGHHCKEKFRNLVRDYNIKPLALSIYPIGQAMCEYMNGSRTARRSRTGAKYFEEFRSHFWEKPEDSFDRIRNMNISNRRRGRGIVSPAPSIDMIEQVLDQRSSSRRSQSRSNQRGRT
ncbi:8224_t:CDS:2, partial [Funneliformis geosporum]